MEIVETNHVWEVLVLVKDDEGNEDVLTDSVETKTDTYDTLGYMLEDRYEIGKVLSVVYLGTKRTPIDKKVVELCREYVTSRSELI